jgi:hypothetical protein
VAGVSGGRKARKEVESMSPGSWRYMDAYGVRASTAGPESADLPRRRSAMRARWE